MVRLSTMSMLAVRPCKKEKRSMVPASVYEEAWKYAHLDPWPSCSETGSVFVKICAANGLSDEWIGSVLIPAVGRIDEVMFDEKPCVYDISSIQCDNQNITIDTTKKKAINILTSMMPSI